MTGDDDLLKKVVDRILAVAAPERIILFGSTARGLEGRRGQIFILDFILKVHMEDYAGRS